jgi:hypothetical protein
MVPHSSYLALSPLTLPLAALTIYTHSALSKVIVPLLLTPTFFKFNSTSSIQLNRDLPLFLLVPLCLPLTSLLFRLPLLLLLLLLLFSTYTAAFKAYCAIWVRRSNFHHQASPRVSPRESTQRRKVELWARNVRKFCLNADLQVTFRDLLHAIKLRHGTDGFTFAEDFFTLKIRRLRPGANPRTWVPKASTLPLDHGSRCPLHHALLQKYQATTGYVL